MVVSKSWDGDSASSKLTNQYDSKSVDVVAGTGHIANPLVKFYSASGWYDSVNSVAVSGGAVVDKTWTNTAFNGGTTTFDAAWQTVTLRYGGTTTVAFTTTVKNISFFMGDSSTDVFTLNVVFDPLPYLAPAAPTTVTLTRVSDAVQRCTFGGNVNSTAAAGYTGNVEWTYQVDSDTAAWQTGATLPGSATTFDLGGCAAGHRYRVAIRFTNADAVSAWSYSSWIHTTPLPPTGMTATRNGASLVQVTVPLSSSPHRTGFALWGEANSSGVLSARDGGALISGETYSDAAAGTSAWRYYATNVVTGVPLAAGGTTTLSSAQASSALVVAYPDTPGIPQPKRKAVVGETTSVTWALAGTSTSATKPYVTQEVQVQQGADDGPAINVATAIGPTITSVEHGSGANSRYRYRVRALNASGASAWSSWSSWIATTPSAPTIGTVTRTGTNVLTVTWGNTAPYRTGSRLGWSENGGAEFDPGIAAAAADSSASRTVDPAKTHRYRAYHVVSAVPLLAGGTTTLTSTGSAWSDTVQLQAPPLAATVNVSSVLFDAATTALTISITHNAVDASAQQQAEVQYRLVGAATWTVVALGTGTTLIRNAGTLTNEQTYEIQARTKGADPTWGPWSASKLVKTTGTPVTSIVSPADGTIIITSTLDVTASVADPGGGAASLWDIEVTRSGQVQWSLLSQPGGSTSITRRAPITAEDGSTYVIRVRARDSAGLWSTWVTSTVSVDYANPPETQVVAAVWDSDTGRTTLSLSSPAPGPGQVAATSQEVQWFHDGQWETVASDLPVLTGGAVLDVIDYIPAPGGQTLYRVISRSALPSSMIGTPFSVATPGDGWIYLNGLEDFAALAKVRGNPAMSWSGSRSKTFIVPLGRRRAIEMLGDAEDDSWRVSGAVANRRMKEAGLGTAQPWKEARSWPAPVCLRDWTGLRVFVSVVSVEVDTVTGVVTAELRQVDYD